MSIIVELADPKHMLPIRVSFGEVRSQRFTKKAAIKLKNKLQLALDELEEVEAEKDSVTIQNIHGKNVEIVLLADI